MERLRHIREQSGYSQQDLADESGVSQHTISEIELGRRRPQGRTLRKLAKVLGVEVADLFGEAEYPLGEAPPSSQLTLNGALEEDRREAIYRPWLDFVNRYADRWEARIAAGDFDLGNVNEFIATVEDLMSVLHELNTDEVRGLPDQPSSFGVPGAKTGVAIWRLAELIDPLIKAGTAKFDSSELEQLRRKRDEARRALERSA